MKYEYLGCSCKAAQVGVLFPSLLLFGYTSHTRPPVPYYLLSRSSALMSVFLISMDVRSCMLSGYEPRNAFWHLFFREGERERPGEVNFQSAHFLKWRWIQKVALIGDSFLAGLKTWKRWITQTNQRVLCSVKRDYTS